MNIKDSLGDLNYFETKVQMLLMLLLSWYDSSISWWSFSFLYRDDIVFKDPLNTFTGIENYKSIFWALRFHGRIFFRALWIDIISVWQPMEGMIMIRWTVHGIPRVPWESRGRFDGTSEYKLDKDGKIYEHRVHNIALKGPPKFHVLAVQELIGYISHPSTPKPTFFKISFPYFGNTMPLAKFADTDIALVQFSASVKERWRGKPQRETALWQSARSFDQSSRCVAATCIRTIGIYSYTLYIQRFQDQLNVSGVHSHLSGLYLSVFCSSCLTPATALG